MSDQQSSSSSKLSKNSSDIHLYERTDIHLYERVRLQSFRSLLNGSSGRVYSSPGRHPRVVLEDLLKAELLSSQLVLAIEDLVTGLQGMLDGTAQENGEDYGMSSTTEDESIKSFRSALAQSANTLNELTKLQISENARNDAQTIENGSLFANTASMVADHGTVDEKDNAVENRQILSYGSGSTTPGEKSSSFSARGNDLSSASPSDVTTCEEDGMSGGEENLGKGVLACLQEAVQTLHNEILELQTKHEVQFMTFAAKFMEFEQGDHRNMRRIHERILQKLSPQDQNWTFHGRLDEAEMEQLFYFVLLQKTLKSCLEVINTAKVGEYDRKLDHEDIQLRLHENNIVQERGDIVPSLNNALCANCCQPLKGVEVGKTNEQYQTYGNRTTLGAPKNDTQYNSSDSNEEPPMNGSSKSNGKRPHDFEDEHENKKRKKGKSLFACFSAKWPRRKKRSKNKSLQE